MNFLLVNFPEFSLPLLFFHNPFFLLSAVSFFFISFVVYKILCIYTTYCLTYSTPTDILQDVLPFNLSILYTYLYSNSNQEHIQMLNICGFPIEHNKAFYLMFSKEMKKKIKKYSSFFLLLLFLERREGG